MKISSKDFIAFGLGSVAAAALGPKAEAQLVQKPRDLSHAALDGIMNRPARYRQVYDVAKLTTASSSITSRTV